MSWLAKTDSLIREIHKSTLVIIMIFGHGIDLQEISAVKAYDRNPRLQKGIDTKKSGRLNPFLVIVRCLI